MVGRRAGGRGRGDAARGAGAASGEPRALRVLVYSSSRTVRADVVEALGPRPAPGLPPVEYLEAATGDAVIEYLDAQAADAAILDGEAAPTGGMGLARQLRDELLVCPPLLVIVGRRADAWLARWSRADAVAMHPLDPFEFAETASGLLRRAADDAAAAAGS